MENKIVYNEEKFDSFLNKTIILSSKAYFKKQMRIANREKTIIDDEENSILEGVSMLKSAFSTIDDIENTLELNSALQSLSAIEQSVIFLLFKEDLSQDDAAKILEICSKSVSRIKLRAIDKLRKYIKGDVKNDR
ncbi:MAG: sigma-70 family RNA polymerase sigma factor [Clostridia bacterium]|nr:sigma-70 family RNA polymerase sigma factor [Clostridia bacterium]